jgi:hypothetical protein
VPTHGNSSGNSNAHFRGSTRVVGRADDPHGADISVEVYGSQGAAGDVTRLIAIDEDDHERFHLTSSAHARALLEAADERPDASYDSITTDSLEGLQARMVEVVDELLSGLRHNYSDVI